MEATLPIWMEFLLVRVEGVVDTSEGWSALTPQVRVEAPDSLGSTSGVLTIDMACHAPKAWQFLGPPAPQRDLASRDRNAWSIQKLEEFVAEVEIVLPHPTS